MKGNCHGKYLQNILRGHLLHQNDLKIMCSFQSEENNQANQRSMKNDLPAKEDERTKEERRRKKEKRKKEEKEKEKLIREDLPAASARVPFRD